MRSTPPETQPDQKQSKISFHLTVYTSRNTTFTFYPQWHSQPSRLTVQMSENAPVDPKCKGLYLAEFFLP